MYSDQKATAATGYGASDAERPESTFTSRIRTICDRTDTFARRLDRVLQNLRGVPPPSPVAGGPGTIRQSCIDDYLGQTESSAGTIEELIQELERLVG